jgi:Ca2+-transporting ATPase
MGIAGTDITKQVASIVLNDDNFSTIAKAVEEGRIIYDNIQKFILYILSCNASQIVIVLICMSLNAQYPFTAMQILYANIIAVVPPSMALGVDAPESDVMGRPPRLATASILGVAESLLLLSHTFSMATIPVAAYLKFIWIDGFTLAESRVTVWVMFVCLNLTQGFLSRSKSRSVFLINQLTNKWMIGGVLLAFCLLIIGVYVPGIQTILENVNIGGIPWAYILGGIGAHLVLNEISKIFFRWHLTIFEKRYAKQSKKRTDGVQLNDVVSNQSD